MPVAPVADSSAANRFLSYRRSYFEELSTHKYHEIALAW